MENLHPAIAQFMYAQAPAPAAKRPMVIRRRVTAQLEASVAAVDAARPKIVYREFPELPPGVIPRDEAQLRHVSVQRLAGDGRPVLAADGIIAMDEPPTVLIPGEVPRTKLATDQNPFASNGWGFGAAGGFGTGLWFPGYPYLAELTQVSEYRAPCETIATEMTRKWFELQSKGGAKKKTNSDPSDDEPEGDDPEIAADSDDAVKGDKSDRIAKIMARVEELKVRDHFRRAALIDCEFGAAHIYLNIGDADERVRQLPLELTPESIKVGSLKGIQTIEPYWVTPYSWNSMYPERPDFYKPTSRYIMGRKTNSTRILTFIGREVPDILKPAYNFGGISLIQLGQESVNFWLRTRKAVNDLINNFSIPVLSTDLAATLEEGGELGSGLIPRLQQLTLTRNNQMVAAINKDTEELSFAEATLASLDKLQAQSQEHMAAVWRIPLVKLTGITPSGLNASSEGEIQVWYDLINAMQISLFEPNLYALLKVIQLDLDGTIDDDLVIHWVSLDEPTAKELSEIRKSDADAGVGYINAGVISPEEERERLQDDPLSGYENLDGPPPEPPMPEEPTTDPEGDANREHEASEADLQRGHESGQAALKMAAAAASAKKEPAIPIRPKTKD